MAQGCYTPLYLPASFKGVPFQAMEVTSEHGRRGAEGEFPFGEDTAYADLGRRIRVYSLEGRIVHNAHLVNAAALIAVCESVGPGILIHPTRGLVRAACRSLKVKDDPLEAQGVTYVTLEMVEAEDWTHGFNFVAQIIGLSLLSITSALQASFTTNFRPSAVPAFEKPVVVETARGAIEIIRDTFGDVTTGSTDLKVSRIYDDLDTFSLDDEKLKTPASMFNGMKLGLGAIDKYSVGETKYEAMRRIVNQFASATGGNRVADISIDSVYAVMRVLGAGYMARAALEQTPDTLDAALRQYDQVVTILESEIEVARAQCNNLLFLALKDFKTQSEVALLNRAYNLPSLIIYNFSVAQHSLVAAYEIYGDAKRARELEARNPHALVHNMGPEIVAST